MLDSSKVFHLLKVAAPLVLIVWALGYFTTPNERSEFLRKFQNERKLFVNDYLQHEVDGQIDGAGISKFCAAKNWNPDLILSCEPAIGGIGLAKNAHLHCIRLAMEFGASVVLPQIVRRSDLDIAKLIKYPSKGPMRGDPLDYFFDAKHLNWTLSNYCPQMKMYSSMNDLVNVPSTLTPLRLKVDDLTSNFEHKLVIMYPEVLTEAFFDWLDRASPPEKRKRPIRAHLDTTMFRFPVAHDGPEFARNFGRVLRIREDARRLAASGLFNLQKTFNLALDPRQGIKEGSFVGVNLRTEKDAMEKGFPDYEEQAAYYLDYIVQSGAKVAYLATGATQEHVDAFKKRAGDFGVTVVMKKDILSPDEFAQLQRMTWDQRALVDYEILMRAGLMTGTSHSSFAWNIALRRRHAYGNDDTNFQPQGDSHEVQFHDKFSAIYGNSTDLIEAMKKTIWP